MNITDKERQYTDPFWFLVLTLPYGISSGFASITLPFILVQNGYTVGEAAMVTALGISANLYRFIWAPLTDLSLSLHKWYILGTLLCSATLLLICFFPLSTTGHGVLSFVVFISQVAATLVMSPTGGFMARTVASDKKGRAGGMFQAGNFLGLGLGGGAGIWLYTHFDIVISGTILSAVMLACMLPLKYVVPVSLDGGISMKDKFRQIIPGIKEMLINPMAIFTILLILTPIGAGCASYIWSSVGDKWKVNSDTVALVTGTLSGLVGGLGCIVGGYMCDKLGMFWTYFTAGVLQALVVSIMAWSGYDPSVYVCGVLLYAFTFGLTNAAFSTVMLKVVGTKLSATNYALLSSIGNLSSVYMTAFDGWMVDVKGIKGMLLAEGLLGSVFVIIFLLLLSRVRRIPVKS